MTTDILQRTLQHLRASGVRGTVRRVRLTRFFTVTELDDGAIGACMSYYNLCDNVLLEAEPLIEDVCADPFSVLESPVLSRVLSVAVPDTVTRELLASSVLCSIAGALSSRIIQAGGDESFYVEKARPVNWATAALRALIVGYGGLMGPLLAEGNLRELRIIDLSYRWRRDELDSAMRQWAVRFPQVSMSISASLANPGVLRSFDIIAVTGSTLCNGTLPFFLDNRRKDATIIMQGQSASVHPKVLFEEGVDWIATTIKPAWLGDLIANGRSGRELRDVLQGGLPWIYLYPALKPPISWT